MSSAFAPPESAPQFDRNWPYPFWIAHRGAGHHAPENTLAAIRWGAEQGYAMFECDVKLSLDEVAYLLHDDSLARTTNANTTATYPVEHAQHWPWQSLSELDAGAWHSPAFAGEHLPRLEEVAALCAELGLVVNLEMKPCPGRAALTGRVVAQWAHKLWRAGNARLQAMPPPLLSSFEQEALQSAFEYAPELPRALLSEHINEAILMQARALECVAVVLHYPAWSTEWVVRCHTLGMHALCYTVNAPDDAQALQAMGVDGIISDEVVRFNPRAPRTI